jgi:predicted transcriptional regulator
MTILLEKINVSVAEFIRVNDAINKTTRALSSNAKDLGLALDDYIQEKGISQRKLASEIGISHVYISEIIKGIRKPSPMVIKKIIKWINKQK